jgi:sugar O-acyltransferase (sialic acid O-acetyltransferase NeuD family)
MRRLAMIGGGGFAKEVAEIAGLNGYAIVGCYAQAPGHFGAIHRGYLDELLRDRNDFDALALAIGGADRKSIAVRRKMIDWIEDNGLSAPALVSPHAIVAGGVVLGQGAVIAHGAILSVDVNLAPFCVVNAGAIVGHDTLLASNVTVAPGAFLGGGCNVGADTLVGPMAKVLQGVSIGQDVIVGVGCIVMQNLKAGAAVWPDRNRVINAATPAPV